MGAEAVLSTRDHRAGCTDLSLSNGACRFDIDDDRGLQIDQV
jgi:hypothetical protein